MEVFLTHLHQLWTPEYNLSIDVWTMLWWLLTLCNLSYLQGGCFEVGAYSRLGANRVNTVHAYIDSQREILIWSRQ